MIEQNNAAINIITPINIITAINYANTAKMLSITCNEQQLNF